MARYFPSVLPRKEPLNDIRQACKPVFPLQIAVEASSLQMVEAAHFVGLVQHALDDSNDFSAHHLRLRAVQDRPLSNLYNSSQKLDVDRLGNRDTNSLSPNDALLVRLIPSDRAATPEILLQPQSAILEVRYSPNQIPSTSSSSSNLATILAQQLKAIFEEEQAIIEHTLTHSSWSSSSGQSSQNSQSLTSAARDLRSRPNGSLRPELADRLAHRLTRALKYSPVYHITISLFTPTAAPSSWEIRDAVSEVLNPLLGPISRISNSSVDTQIQLHATFAPSVQPPTYDAEHSMWTLREEDLSGFINAAEWPLSPSIAAGPTLNFIVYVPDPSNIPLTIGENQATSWLVPQWGGIFILNSQSSGNESVLPSTLTKESLRPAMLTFSHQFLALLGVPQSPQSLQLQLRSLIRIQAASLLLSASSTMGSLARLTKALPTIAIPKTVSTAVDVTLSRLRNTCDALKEGNFHEALENARLAEIHAEKGFFEKSMVGQVYFPDEHKVAVYLPLLGPVGVPLLMSATKELKRLSNAWRTRGPAT